MTFLPGNDSQCSLSKRRTNSGILQHMADLHLLVTSMVNKEGFFLSKGAKLSG